MRWPIPSASHHKPPNSTERRVSSLANMNDGIGQPAWHSIVPRGLLWMWKQLKHEFMYRELDTHQNWELHLHIRVAHSQLFVYILFIWWRLLERTQAAAAAAYENVECGRLFERKQEHGNRVICMRGNERERERARMQNWPETTIIIFGVRAELVYQLPICSIKSWRWHSWRWCHSDTEWIGHITCSWMNIQARILFFCIIGDIAYTAFDEHRPPRIGIFLPIQYARHACVGS